MSAVSLAIIGKGNEPLYLREFGMEEHVDDAELFNLSGGGGVGNNATEAGDSSDGNNDNNDNKPTTSEGTCSLRQEFVLHAALDRFEQLNGPPPGFAWRQQQQQQYQAAVPLNSHNTDPQFVGLLGPWEDLRLYGWMTTTQIKFLVAIQDAEIDGDIVGLLRRLHQTYVEYRLNPLGSLNGPIISKRFDEKVRQTVESYNRSVM